MISQTFTLRIIALIFAIAFIVFAIIAGYRYLQTATDALQAPMLMAAVSAGIAGLLVTLAHFRAKRRRARLHTIISSLLDNKPIAGLAAALVAGAAARFGLEPEELYPVFEAFADTNPTTPPPQPSTH